MLSVLKQNNSSDVAVMWMLGILTTDTLWRKLSFFPAEKDACVKGIEMSDLLYKRKLSGRANMNFGF